MSTDESPYPIPLRPTSTLEEVQGDTNDENGDAHALETEERNFQPHNAQNHNEWRGLGSLPNDPSSPAPTQSMSHACISDSKLGTASPATYFHQTNDWCADPCQQTFFSQEEHYFAHIGGMASTDQPEPFETTAPTSSAYCGTSHQQQLLAANCDDSVVMGSTSLCEATIKSRATNDTLPLARESVTSFDSIVPEQRPALPFAAAPPPVPDPESRQDSSIIASSRTNTVSPEILEDITHESVQVTSKQNASKWLKNFKQFVFTQMTGSKIGKPLSNWLYRQQILHLRGRLNPKRRDLLAQSGALLDTQKRNRFRETQAQKTQWMLQYEKLKKHRLVEGNFNLSKSPDKSLLYWMRTQRSRYQEWRDGVFDMPSYRIAKLEEIGFEWPSK